MCVKSNRRSLPTGLSTLRKPWGWRSTSLSNMSTGPNTIGFEVEKTEYILYIGYRRVKLRVWIAATLDKAPPEQTQ